MTYVNDRWHCEIHGIKLGVLVHGSSEPITDINSLLYVRTITRLTFKTTEFDPHSVYIYIYIYIYYLFNYLFLCSV